MTGLVRKATLFTACGLLLAGAALASVPSAGNSTIPCAIKIVGHDGGGPPTTSPNHTIQVNVRDLANQPINNSSVVVDFSGCGDVKPSGGQNGVNGEQVDCVTKTVRAFTDVNGDVSIDAAGMADALNVAAGGTPGGACATIFADGVSLGTVQVAVFDLDGVVPFAEGAGASDFSEFLDDFFNCPQPGSPAYCARSDYDFVDGGCATQNVGAADFSVFLGEFFSGASASNDPVCP